MKTKNPARRKLLKSLVAGGGVLATGKLLPENWSRPVVESVLLPAHAQFSPTHFDGVYRFDNQLQGNSADGPADSILDMFVSPAQAQTVNCSNVASIQFNITGTLARVCLTAGSGASDSETTSVDLETGNLGDVEPFNFDLVNMQVDSEATRIDFRAPPCGSFTAFRTSIPFICDSNSTMTVHLSSPYKDKA